MTNKLDHTCGRESNTVLVILDFSRYTNTHTSHSSIE
jgi:hypothetical protein